MGEGKARIMYLGLTNERIFFLMTHQIMNGRSNFKPFYEMGFKYDDEKEKLS